jgi:hypothetical protein
MLINKCHLINFHFVFIYLDHAETVHLKPKCAAVVADLSTLKKPSPPLYIFHTYYQS